VIVFGFVQEYGVAMLGPVLILAGVIQLGAGLLRLGQWFRAISPAVVHGMLAGIGLLIVAGQIQVLFDGKPLSNGLDNLAAIPLAFAAIFPLEWSSSSAALFAGLATVIAMLIWERARPKRFHFVPGALIGVSVGTLLCYTLSLPIKRVQVPDSIGSSLLTPTIADLMRLAEPGLIIAAIVIAVIASAETLLSAAAVDRMHDGTRTNYDRELSAQGIGNLLCGLVGALPMTGVIVRSSANVQAGAATRLSAILHGVWILGFVALLPWLLREVPTASLAGILVVTGWRLISLHHVRALMHRHGFLPVVIWTATVAMVVATDLLTGVLIGLALSLIEVVPHVRRMPLRVLQRRTGPTETEIELSGAATFVHLPRLSRALEQVPYGDLVRLKTEQLAHIDHTCIELISEWAGRNASSGMRIQIDDPSMPRHAVRLAAALR
jgi:MFS superfamily sulfate permease-like transporter